MQWLVSDHRYGLVKETPNLSAEKVYEVLKEKGHRQWKDLSHAFIRLDTNKTGRITKSNLREILQRFILPMTEEEFNLLWRM